MGDRFAGAVAVVTGGSSGIGKASAKALAARGAKVYLLARSRERLQQAADEIRRAGGEAYALPVDVTSPEQLAQAAQAVEAAHGKLDVVIAGAGVMDLGPVEAMPEDALTSMMQINYFGVVHTVRSFLPLIKKGEGKRIAILSSLASKVAPPYFGPYSASKAAVTGFAHALRQELRPQGIKVVLVHPGPTATPLVDGYIGGAYYPVPPGVPVVSPELVAEAIVRAVARGRREVFVPRRLAVTAWLAGIFPGAVDWTYRIVGRSGHGGRNEQAPAGERLDHAEPD